MRPDEYKQSQSRKYQAKLRSRDSEASKEIQEKRKERSSKSRGGLQNKSGDKEYKETEEIGEENDKPKRQSFRKRKVESNSYRYKDISDTEEAIDGIDLGTRNLLQMIDDSETRSFDPSIYFQFKEEKDWDTSVDASVNEDEIYQNLMNIRFDELELSLSNVSLAERLDLIDDIFTEKQETNVDSSLYTTGPIVPKTVRSIPIVPQKFISKNVKPIEIPTSVQSSTSNNIIKEPQSKKTIEIDLGKKIVANNASQASASTNKKPISHSLISNKDDDDIDDFLKSLDEENAKQIKPTSSLPNNKRGTKKISINLKNQNKITAGKNDDDTEDWLDDILK
ncbi:hypothetical protein RhiirA5_358586 [Rhizophagus irregularis]|uniref:Uncharacterized protein n=2 Tax=Rhizophagus irregularis TaxID=588596 RepID=A0A2N0PM77_9GLOM|nr:hypothetical protein RhiirA5_358586 [Rhizophagus irregularis]CAB5206244.1 unnamed protein product [Rhizophagus irregularis]